MFAREIPVTGLRVLLTPETEAKMMASWSPYWHVPSGAHWVIVREEGILQRLRAFPINPQSGESLWPNHWLGVDEDMEVIPINP